MFGFSIWEWAIVLLVVLLVFGVKKVPLLGRSLGEAIRQFRKALQGKDSDSNLKDVKPDKKDY